VHIVAPALLHVEVWSFVFEKREPISRNGLVFDDIRVSKCQGTWRAYDAVTDKVRGEVQYNNRYLCSPSVWETIFMIHNMLSVLARGVLEWYGHWRRQCIEVHSTDVSAWSAENFFAFIILLCGWVLVVPSCFALHCHWLLFSMSSMT